jgi:TPR repeat protein
MVPVDFGDKQNYHRRPVVQRALLPQERDLPMNLRRALIHVVLACIALVCIAAASAYWTTVPAWAQDVNIESLRKQAKEGNAEAQYRLADSYLNGTDGVSKDLKQGVEWLRKAADLEHAAAQNALWVMYRNGFLPYIPKDPKKGLEWLRKSADHGYATAEYNLALLYRDGDSEVGIPRKPHEAAIWFRKAARQPGSGKSQASLEEMLQKRLISAQEANWRAADPSATVPLKASTTGKAAPFSIVEVETGLKGWITSNRMATLVQAYGVNFRLTAGTRKRLADDGADDHLLEAISASKRGVSPN